jgi:uncharacterized membrane protein
MSRDRVFSDLAREKRRALHGHGSSRSDRIADAMTRFSGSMTFVVLHAVWFAIWIVLNLALPAPFDPFPFGLLTLVVSLEAIFLSTFVLISQNRQGAKQAVRSRIEFETDIQSDVWSEMIAEKLGVDPVEVDRRVRLRLADADRQSGSDESPAQADVPSS